MAPTGKAPLVKVGSYVKYREAVWQVALIQRRAVGRLFTLKRLSPGGDIQELTVWENIIGKEAHLLPDVPKASFGHYRDPIDGIPRWTLDASEDASFVVIAGDKRLALINLFSDVQGNSLVVDVIPYEDGTQLTRQKVLAFTWKEDETRVNGRGEHKIMDERLVLDPAGKLSIASVDLRLTDSNVPEDSSS